MAAEPPSGHFRPPDPSHLKRNSETEPWPPESGQNSTYNSGKTENTEGDSVPFFPDFSQPKIANDNLFFGDVRSSLDAHRTKNLDDLAQGTKSYEQNKFLAVSGDRGVSGEIRPSSGGFLGGGPPGVCYPSNPAHTGKIAAHSDDVRGGGAATTATGETAAVRGGFRPPSGGLCGGAPPGVCSPPNSAPAGQISDETDIAAAPPPAANAAGAPAAGKTFFGQNDHRIARNTSMQENNFLEHPNTNSKKLVAEKRPENSPLTGTASGTVSGNTPVHDNPKTTYKPPINPTLDLSNNFKPYNPKDLKNPAFPATTSILPPKSKLQNDQNPKPLTPTVTQPWAARLKAVQTKEPKTLEFSPPKITTKQGYPAVLFKKEDYMVKIASRCKYTLVGKFNTTMPKMEAIRKSFILQTQLKGGVKIAHFNSKHIYIDLENEEDHLMVWTKQRMYIEGKLMRLQLWTPTFKPEVESPIVPVWVTLPELPWHYYDLELITALLTPIGKALYLDAASLQKTRGSVAKVRIQIDVTKERPSHIWLGFDEDDITQGKWQNIQYEDIPYYCVHCKQLGHLVHSCKAKQREDEKKGKDIEGQGKNNGKGIAKDIQHGTGDNIQDPSKVSTSHQINNFNSNLGASVSGIKDRQEASGKEQTPINTADPSQTNASAPSTKDLHQNVLNDTNTQKEGQWQTQKRKKFKGQQQQQVFRQLPSGNQNGAAHQIHEEHQTGITAEAHQIPIEYVDPGVQDQPPHPPVNSAVPTPPQPPIGLEVEGGMNGGKQEEPINLQEGVSKGGDQSHVSPESPLVNHRTDSKDPVTTAHPDTEADAKARRIQELYDEVGPDFLQKFYQIVNVDGQEKATEYLMEMQHVLGLERLLKFVELLKLSGQSTEHQQSASSTTCALNTTPTLPPENDEDEDEYRVIHSEDESDDDFEDDDEQEEEEESATKAVIPPNRPNTRSFTSKSNQ